MNRHRSESAIELLVVTPVQWTTEIAGWKLAIYTQRETNNNTLDNLTAFAAWDTKCCLKRRVDLTITSIKHSVFTTFRHFRITLPLLNRCWNNNSWCFLWTIFDTDLLTRHFAQLDKAQSVCIGYLFWQFYDWYMIYRFFLAVTFGISTICFLSLEIIRILRT